MGFPESILASNERVVRHLHPHWLTVVGPTVVGLLLLVLSLLTVRWTPDDETGNRIQWIAVVVMVVVAVPMVVVPYLRWRTTHYVVTSHRVMVRRGILSKSGKDITLSKITDVSFEQSMMDRIVRAGTLLIESAGDSPNEYLRNIPHSDDVQQLVNLLIDEDANRRAGRIVERIEHQRVEGPWSEESGIGPSTTGESGVGEPASEVPASAGEAAERPVLAEETPPPSRTESAGS